MNHPSERNRPVKRATLPEVQINFHLERAPDQDPRGGDIEVKRCHVVNAAYGSGHVVGVEKRPK